MKFQNRANLIGAVWMIASMAAFAVEDVFIKAVSSTLPIGQILIIFGLSGAIIFAVISLRNGESLYNADVTSRPMLLRVFFEIVGRLFYILAITLTPMSSATVILQATPILVVAGSAVVFREKVGVKRWAAILVGLLGVLIIIQPGAESFSILSIFAVIGTIGFAGRDLASRAAPAKMSTSSLGLYGFLAVVIAGLAYSLWEGSTFVWLNMSTAFYLAGAVVFGVGAYASLMKAMRTGDVSAVTPFRYTRLLFGVGFGVLLFKEPFSSTMMIGCAFIVLSGVIIMARGRRVEAAVDASS